MASFLVLCGWAVVATFLVLFCPWFTSTPLRAPVAALAFLFRLFRFSRHLIRRDLFIVIGFAEKIILDGACLVITISVKWG